MSAGIQPLVPLAPPTSEHIFYKNPDLELFLHKAYLDDRYQQTYIRIYGLQQKGHVTGAFLCRFPSIEEGGMFLRDVPAKFLLVDASWPKDSPYNAVNFDCKLPKGESPESVELRLLKETLIFAHVVKL